MVPFISDFWRFVTTGHFRHDDPWTIDVSNHTFERDIEYIKASKGYGYRINFDEYLSKEQKCQIISAIGESELRSIFIDFLDPDVSEAFCDLIRNGTCLLQYVYSNHSRPYSKGEMDEMVKILSVLDQSDLVRIQIHGGELSSTFNHLAKENIALRNSYFLDKNNQIDY